MFRKKLASLALVIVIFTTVACSVTGTNAAALIQNTATAQLPTKVDYQATAHYWATYNQKAQQTAIESNMATMTATAEAGYTTATQKAIDVATEQILSTATVEANSMQRKVDFMKSRGQINSTNGIFFKLPDFDQSYASMGNRLLVPTSYSARNFIIKANTFWDSNNAMINTYQSGCGFAFHQVDDKNYYFITLGLDGRVHLYLVQNGRSSEIGTKLYGQVGVPRGGALIMLVVENGNITYYVNEKLIFQQTNFVLPTGKVDIAIASGTNAKPGFRCQMTGASLWIIQ
jgi:hypothetical protein